MLPSAEVSVDAEPLMDLSIGPVTPPSGRFPTGFTTPTLRIYYGRTQVSPVPRSSLPRQQVFLNCMILNLFPCFGGFKGFAPASVSILSISRRKQAALIPGKAVNQNWL